MRVLISTVGSRGEVQPVVALAREITARGHEAVVVAPPDFRMWAAELGVDYRPVGPELRGTARRNTSAVPTEEQRRRLAEATVAAQFAAVDAAAEGCDLVVGGGGLAIAAASVAEGRGARYAYAAFAPVTLPSPRHAPPVFTLLGERPGGAAADNAVRWEQDARRWNLLWRDALDAQRAARGLGPVGDVRAHLFTARPLLAADPVLAPWPEPAGAVRQTGAWLLTVDRPLPAELRAFLDAGEPPVHVGFGSMPAPAGAADAILEAARAHGRRLVVSGGWAGLSVDAPDCLVVGEVDLAQLYGRVAAVVHHGGAGTTTTAAVAGVPQVLLPRMFDQFYFAERVRELGIGTEAAGPDALADALGRVLAPTVGEQARKVAGEMRRDGVAVAADLLLAD